LTRKFHNPVVCDIYLPCLLERVSEILLPAIQETWYVLYLLGITLIDPIKYNLLFERFLLPERAGLYQAYRFSVHN